MRLLVAALLSAILPGAGHFLVRRQRKGLLLVAVFFVVFLVYSWLRLPSTIAGATLPILVVVGLCVLAAWEAAYAGRNIEAKPSQWWLAVLLPVAVLAGFVHSNWQLRASGFGVYLIPSASMVPTLPLGSRVMVDRSYYRRRTPQHGDVIVCLAPSDQRLFILKRVAAVGGETVEVRGDTVLINGKVITEPYAVFEGALPDVVTSVGPVTVPVGTVFVMGDNRHLSLDSRMFGPIDMSTVRGKAIYVIPSFGRDVRKLD